MKRKIEKIIFLLISATLTCVIFGVIGIQLTILGKETIQHSLTGGLFDHKNRLYGVNPDIVIIHLQNKGKLNGVIKSENEDGIVLDVGYGTVGLAKNEIEKIEYPSDDNKKKLLHDEWRKNINATSMTEHERQRQIQKMKERNIKYLEAIRAKGYRIKFKDSSRIAMEAVLNNKVKVKFLLDTGAPSVYEILPLSRPKLIRFKV